MNLQIFEIRDITITRSKSPVRINRGLRINNPDPVEDQSYADRTTQDRNHKNEPVFLSSLASGTPTEQIKLQMKRFNAVIDGLLAFKKELQIDRLSQFAPTPNRVMFAAECLLDRSDVSSLFDTISELTNLVERLWKFM